MRRPPGTPGGRSRSGRFRLDSQAPDVDSTPPGVHMSIYIRIRLRGVIGFCPLVTGFSDSTHRTESVNQELALWTRAGTDRIGAHWNDSHWKPSDELSFMKLSAPLFKSTVV